MRVIEVIRWYEPIDASHFKLIMITNDEKRHVLFSVHRDLDIFFQGDEFLGAEFIDAFLRASRIKADLDPPSD